MYRIGVYYNGRSGDARIDCHLSRQYVQPIEQDNGRDLLWENAGSARRHSGDEGPPPRIKLVACLRWNLENLTPFQRLPALNFSTPR